ncbi:MAG: aspartate aminotransferase family protein [bacterium]|nr:aspartate aminotransferase family protein [bacterium]
MGMQLWQTNDFNEITITHGEKCTVWDTSGKSYVDMLSGVWCNALGYGHQQWAGAIKEQVSKLTHMGEAFLSEEIKDALSKLKEILPPGLNRAVFLNSGSEAVDLALKMARAATNKESMVIIENSYYGASTYPMILSESGRDARYLPSLVDVIRLPAPNCRQCLDNDDKSCTEKDWPCLKPLEENNKKGDEAIAAVLYEPVLGSGIYTPHIGYGKRLRELASNCKALLIAEEVTTGMGRTGRWFGFQHEEIVPDILAIGKIIGGGLPVAVVVTTEAVERACRNNHQLRHVQSHQNDPFSGRIAAAVISIMQEENLVEKAAEIGERLMEGLKELQQSHSSIICDVRGRGAMLGVELHEDWKDRGDKIVEQFRDEGFIIGYNASTSTMRLYPPFIISGKEIDAFLKAFNKILSNIETG